MQAPINIRKLCRLHRRVILLTALLPPAVSASAQPFQLDLGAIPQAELTAPQIDAVSGPAASRLEQARALVADKNWTEALRIYRDLMNDADGRLVALDENRYMSLPAYCQLQLARLPPDGLAEYRRNADPIAERSYRKAVADRDEEELRRIASDMFCSTWGDDALLVLGETALERGDYESARRWWELISPLLRDPTGMPLWFSMRDVDLDAHWPEIEKRWNDRTQPATWLAYPDTQLDLADVRARLILASIRAGQFDRAELELNVFRHFHGDAAGRLAGQDGPYVPALERLMSSAREWKSESRNANWPTFAADHLRSNHSAPIGDVLVPVWPRPVKLAPMRRMPTDAVVNGLDQFGRPVDESQPLLCFPITVGDRVVFSDGIRVGSLGLSNGEAAINPSGIIYKFDIRNPRITGMRPDINGTILFRAFHGAPRCTLDAAGTVVYTRIGRLATSVPVERNAEPGDRIIGLDLAREGLLAFQIRPDGVGWSFDGTSISDGRRLWVAMKKTDVNPHSYVACYDAIAGGDPLWRTYVCSADSPATGYGDEITHNLLSCAGDRIYFNTNLGVVTALDAQSGQIAWMYRYDRSSSMSLQHAESDPHFERNPSPCLLHDGVLVVAPSDTPAVFALDAITGKLLWKNDDLKDVLHLLGVVENNLIVSGKQVHALDVRSGVPRFAWPESPNAGIRGMGRGVIAGSEIFWPTRDTIYVLNAVTGQRTRAPIDIRHISQTGANLTAAHGHLLIAGPNILTALGPAPIPQPSKN
jgi:hypothetical protein